MNTIALIESCLAADKNAIISLDLFQQKNSYDFAVA